MTRTTPRAETLASAFALVVALALALSLAACSEGVPVPLPEVPLKQSVTGVQVLRADGSGTIAHGTLTDAADPLAPDAPPVRYEWQVQRFDALLARLTHEELQGYDTALAFEDGAQRLWTAQNLEGQQVRLCLRDLTEACAILRPEGIAPDTRRPRIAQDLQADAARGDAVLLLLAGSRWSTAWMRGGLNPLWEMQPLPETAASPRLMHGALGARVAWREGTGLQLWALDDATLRWRSAWVIEDTSAWWAVAQQRGEAGWSWIAACANGQPQVRRMKATSLDGIGAPADLDCARVLGEPKLAVADNGDAMLAWREDDGFWRAAHWDEAARRWGPQERFDEAGIPPLLAADQNGYFALLSFDASEATVMRLYAFRPGIGWQREIRPEPANVGTIADVKVSGGRAVVAWVRAAPGDDPGTRLASAVIDLAADHGTLEVQVQGAGSVVSTPAGITCPGDCRVDLPVGTRVSLEVRPAEGQRFAAWFGDCPGAFPTALFDLRAGTSQCTVRFEPQAGFALEVVVEGGGGSVGANPAGPVHPPGTEVVLTANASPGQRFVAWGGDADCTDGRVTMDAPRRCTARFEPDPALASLTLAVAGGGRVRSTPAGLDCTGACQAFFATGQAVVLTAEPPPGAAITTAWGGACTGTSGLAATLVLTAAAQCSVQFTAPSPQGWAALGGASLPGSGGFVQRPAIAADAAGVPTVAFLVQTAELRELEVVRLVAGGWARVGSAPLNDPLISAGQPALALDDAGRPIVAFGDARGRLQVRHWDGRAWLRLADGLAVAPGAITSAPQVAFDGTRIVVSFFEFQGARTRLALLRTPLGPPAWSGGHVDGVQFEGDGLLRMALDTTGAATLAWAAGSGLEGERAPRAVREGATVWAPHCEGGAGTDPGNGYLGTLLGFGLVAAPGGGNVLVRARSDALAVEAWRCTGTGAWAPDTGGGTLLAVDNVLTFLQAVATSTSGPPTAAVLVGTGYTVGAELHAYAYGAFGFQAVGPPLVLTRRSVLGALAVAPAAFGSPVAAFGEEDPFGVRTLAAARFRP
jgi:hypothetical protein